MKLLDRHIFVELLGPFIFGVAAFATLMFASQELFRMTEMLSKYHMPLLVAVKFVLLSMPKYIVFTLPMSMLLATLLGFGRLSGDSEVVAIFAGGVSFYRIIVPVIIMALCVTGLSFVLSEIVVPTTTSAYEQIWQSLKNEPLSTDKPFMDVIAKDGETSTVFYVQHGIDMANHSLKDVSVIQYWNNKPAAFIYGKEAYWKGGNSWSFKDGYWKSLSSKETVSLIFQGSQTREITIDRTPEQIALVQKGADTLSYAQLEDYIKMIKGTGADMNEYMVQLYQKIAIPLASLVFALVGAPLGLRPQRSSSAMGLGLSIVIIFAYWVLMHYMTILGNNGSVSPMMAGFIPTIAGIGAGGYLIFRAAK